MSEENTHLVALDGRVSTLEIWRTAQDTHIAVRQERDKHLDKRFDRLEEGNREVKGILLRIMWFVILGFLGALVSFVVMGGTSVVVG